MFEGHTISVVLPAYNEEQGIGRAVQDFLATRVVDEVVVVDNNSRDRTAEEARKAGGRVVAETAQGYGNAIRRGLREATGAYVVVCEPDGTFQAADIHKLLAYAGEFDMVLGTRTSTTLIWHGANMGLFLKWGNWAVGKMMELLFNGPSLTDVGCTFRLIRREPLRRIQEQFTVGASHFSPEMMLTAIVNGLRIVEIPVNYGARVGESKITGDKIRAFRLGCRMIGLISWRWLKWQLGLLPARRPVDR